MPGSRDWKRNSPRNNPGIPSDVCSSHLLGGSGSTFRTHPNRTGEAFSSSAFSAFAASASSAPVEIPSASAARHRVHRVSRPWRGSPRCGSGRPRLPAGPPAAAFPASPSAGCSRSPVRRSRPRCQGLVAVLAVARVSRLDEWHLLIVTAFGHHAFQFGAGLGEPATVVLPPLLQPRLEPVGPVGDPMGGDRIEHLVEQTPPGGFVPRAPGPVGR